MLCSGLSFENLRYPYEFMSVKFLSVGVPSKRYFEVNQY